MEEKKKESLFKKTFPYFKREIGWSVVGILLAAIVALAMSLRPQISQLIIDRILNPILGEQPVYSDSNMFNWLIDGFGETEYVGMLITLVAAVIVISLVYYIAHYIRWNITQGKTLYGENRMRDRSFYGMLRQGPLTLANYTSGDLLNITNNDTVAVKDLYLHHIPFIFQALFNVLFSLFFLVRISVYLAIVPLVMGVLSGAVSVSYRRVLRKKYDKIRRGSVELNTFVQENINGVRIVRAFATEENEIKGFKKKNDAFKDNFVELARTQAKYTMAFTIIGETVNIACISIGIWLALRGVLTVGEFATFTEYCMRIRRSITMLAGQMGAIQNCTVCANRFLELADKPEEVEDKPNAAAVPDRPDIALKKVYMRFEDKQYALRGVSLSVPYGRRVAIMGKTGSGKSVLMKLLNRLYDCTGGSISLGGVNIKNLRVDEVRRAYSFVMQDVFLFSESVEKNIAFYDESVPHERVEQVARLACAHDFVEKMSEGYETVIGEKGLGLSGGQKQRVSIARALLKDAPIILLDDCTSALDYETEKQIVENIFDSCGDKTVIMATHRATGAARCDEIIYLEDGKIVEQGTHDELMELKGRYYSVFVEQEALRAKEVH